MFVLYVLEVLHLPPRDYGYVLLVAGVGAIGGSLVTPPLTRRYGWTVVLAAGSVVGGLSTLGVHGLTAQRSSCGKSLRGHRGRRYDEERADDVAAGAFWIR